MIQYNTGIQHQPPISQGMQQQALTGLAAQGQHPSINMDVYNGRAQSAGIDMERAAAKANNEYLMRAQQAQQDMALKGAGQLAQQQANDNNLANQRQGMQLDYAGKLMGGLNGILASLYS